MFDDIGKLLSRRITGLSRPLNQVGDIAHAASPVTMAPSERSP
jgi:hypothetical protein